MSEYHQDMLDEQVYLNKTLEFIKSELKRVGELLESRKNSLKESRKQMWEDCVHSTTDFTKLTEVNQYLSQVSIQTSTYVNTTKQMEKFEKMLGSPYFGRFDFVESGFHEKEKIYIGLYNLMDSNTHDIYVYDWRAPISSIFYQYEMGKVEYKAPYGRVSGEVQLKRQYKIQNSELKYFFDCNVKIDDEMLQEVLRKNSSAKMKNIVETIQREQDTIIRDMDHELLIVQGVAGGGKTSIALHRIAYLLYHGLNEHLSHQNIVIISPNVVFSKYIASVLPELGEENVNQIVFESFAAQTLKGKGKVQTRNQQIEGLMFLKNEEQRRMAEKSIEFKGSTVFSVILDRLVVYFEQDIIQFEDIHYDGMLIETGKNLRDFFLDNKIDMPVAKRLKRIENMILDKIRPFQKQRLKKIEEMVQEMDGHEFDIKPYSRLLSMKESKDFLYRLKRVTEIDYYRLYELLYNEEGLFLKLAHDLPLPENVEEMISYTWERLKKGNIDYEDCAPLLYLKLKLEGNEYFSDVKQVVVDEAQDYTPLHYMIFNRLFKDANFTVLGDINQSMENSPDTMLYDKVMGILNKRSSIKLSMNQSYRSTYEITQFTQSLLKGYQDLIHFERHGDKPEITRRETVEELSKTMIQKIQYYFDQGYESIAIICKTAFGAERLYKMLIGMNKNVKLIRTGEEEIEKGVLIVPSYMAKGLEFDVVIVFDVSSRNYINELDRRLLYIACTRALHRLEICHTGELSPLIQPGLTET
ncbi:MAG: AAA family ATPase [Clostridia bacterium]|nr:AAA family ATPase [Clostridia bacterium]